VKIKHKLQILVAAAVLAMLTIGGLGYYGMSKDNQALGEIGGSSLPSVTNLLILKEAITDLSRNLYTVTAADRLPTLEKKKVEFDVAFTRKADALKRAEAAIKAYEKLDNDAEEKALWEKASKAWTGWIALEKDIIQVQAEAMKNLTNESVHAAAEAHQAMVEQRRPLTRDLNTSLQAIIDRNITESAASYTAAKNAADRALMAQLIAFLIGIAATVAVGYSVMRSVMRPINIAKQTVIDIAASNDLTKRIDYQATDEVGEMVKALNAMLEVVRQSMSRIQDHMASVQSAVNSMSTAAGEVAVSSGHQSSAAASMAASVEEMTVSIATINDSAAEARRLAASSAEISTSGGGIIARTVSEMGVIGNMITQASHVIASLGDDSQKISAVVNVIKEVADQTNLLALNAAIEAARAGEAGRGFAVVADEVRKLAERTTHSTADISGMVEKIQQSAVKAVAEMETMVRQVATGQELAVSAGENVREIQAAVGKVADAIVDISGALKEQNSASQDIAKHVERIAQMTDENHAAADSTSTSARNVDQLAEDVVKTIRVFRV
jgi:methyl-accepting chemotaxis protein